MAFLCSLHCIIRKSNKVVRGHWLLSEHKPIKIGELGKEKTEGYVLVGPGSPWYLTVAHGWLGNLSFFDTEILYCKPCDPGLHMRLKLDSLSFFLRAKSWNISDDTWLYIFFFAVLQSRVWTFKFILMGY